MSRPQEAILPYQAQRVRRHRLDGSQEAYLIALVWSAPPEGSARWTVRLLASTLVELGYVEHISHETVRQVLLANELKPWSKKQWCIPTAPDAEFVYHIEDILQVYTRPYDPARPQVCMDEINTQLPSDTREACVCISSLVSAGVSVSYAQHTSVRCRLSPTLTGDGRRNSTGLVAGERIHDTATPAATLSLLNREMAGLWCRPGGPALVPRSNFFWRTFHRAVPLR